MAVSSDSVAERRTSLPDISLGADAITTAALGNAVISQLLHQHTPSAAAAVDDEQSWWSTMPLRDWETQIIDSDSVSSLHPTPQRSQALHLILIRHGESSNNSLTDLMFGVRPHRSEPISEAALAAAAATAAATVVASAVTTSPHDAIMSAYNLRRSADPDLTPLGYRQAQLLPSHPYLQPQHGINLPSLAAQQRVQFICSPMYRAMLTSTPLLQSLGAVAEVVVDWSERGGAYEGKKRSDSSSDHSYDNIAVAGRSQSVMQAEFSATHQCSAVPESGWWTQHCVLSSFIEEDELFEVRLERLQKGLHARAREHALAFRQNSKKAAAAATATSATTATVTAKDWVVVVCHADLIDELLSRLLGCRAKRYCFYTVNTAIAHVELLWSPSAADSEGTLEARIRGSNIKPAAAT